MGKNWEGGEVEHCLCLEGGTGCGSMLFHGCGSMCLALQEELPIWNTFSLEELEKTIFSLKRERFLHDLLEMQFCVCNPANEQ